MEGYGGARTGAVSPRRITMTRRGVMHLCMPHDIQIASADADPDAQPALPGGAAPCPTWRHIGLAEASYTPICLHVGTGGGAHSGGDGCWGAGPGERVALRAAHHQPAGWSD